MTSLLYIAQFLVIKANLLAIWKIFFSICTVALIGVTWIIVKNALRRNKYSAVLPGRKLRSIDVWGNFSDIPLRQASRNGYSMNVFLLQIVQGYSQLFKGNKLFCIWISYVPFVVLVKAEAVEALISSTKHTEQIWSYNMLQPWLGMGLLTSHGGKWKSRRRLVTPSFHFEILRDFLPVFNEHAQILVKRLRKEITKEFTDIVPLVTNCSLDIICETTLGVRIGAQQNSESKYVKCVERASEIIVERMFKVWLWPDFIFHLTEKGQQLEKDIKFLHNFTRSIIQERKMKILDEGVDIGQRKRKALMDLLLDLHIKDKSLSEEDIREEVDTFTFGGHGTVAMGMSWALFLIGHHKEIQAKLHEELDDIFGDDFERPVTLNDVKNMKYLECALKESQRIYPSVSFTGRNVSEDTNICGYTIPKGVTCGVLTYELHRDERIFPEPEKFDPDRFLPENAANRHPYAYIPFSAGPRNCIGQRFAVTEGKIVMSAILRNFAVESLDQRDKLLPVPELILRPSIPIRIKIRPRYINNTYQTL